jgi:hypothetical protein
MLGLCGAAHTVSIKENKFRKCIALRIVSQCKKKGRVDTLVAMTDL